MSDSLLTKRFGEETINFFAGSALNRFSFKRPDTAWLSKCLLDPSTKFLAFNNLDPLATKAGTLVYSKLDELKDIVGNPYEITYEEQVKNWSAEDESVIVVFLGLDESKPTETGGEAYFAVDVTPRPLQNEKAKQKFIDAVKEQGLEFKNVRVGVKFEQHEGSMVAMGRSLIDWNARNLYCNGCGGKTISVWAVSFSQVKCSRNAKDN